MPSDVSVELVTQTVAEAHSRRRLPVGVGLAIGACTSVALWACIGLGLSMLLA